MNKEKMLKKICNEHLKEAFRSGRTVETKLEQAIEAAKGNDLQEAILKLCEAVRQLENEVSYLQ